MDEGLPPDVSAVLGALLTADDPVHAGLREQLPHLRVRNRCSCGCGSAYFEVDTDAVPPTPVDERRTVVAVGSRDPQPPKRPPDPTGDSASWRRCATIPVSATGNSTASFPPGWTSLADARRTPRRRFRSPARARHPTTTPAPETPSDRPSPADAAATANPPDAPFRSWRPTSSRRWPRPWPERPRTTSSWSCPEPRRHAGPRRNPRPARPRNTDVGRSILPGTPEHTDRPV